MRPALPGRLQPGSDPTMPYPILHTINTFLRRKTGIQGELDSLRERVEFLGKERDSLHALAKAAQTRQNAQHEAQIEIAADVRKLQSELTARQDAQHKMQAEFAVDLRTQRTELTARQDAQHETVAEAVARLSDLSDRVDTTQEEMRRKLQALHGELGGLDRISGMARAFEYGFKSELTGDYWEFGVGEGGSLVRAYHFHRQFSKDSEAAPAMRFLAFDTFEGIPDLQPVDELENYGVFKKGQYSYSVEEVKQFLRYKKVDLEQFSFIQGLYSESLQREDVAQLVKDAKVSIVHIDCDLYSSAGDVLTFIEPYLVEGGLILFDDWFCYRGRSDKGVHGAFEHWLETTAWTAEEYFRYDWGCICFIMNKYPEKASPRIQAGSVPEYD